MVYIVMCTYMYVNRCYTHAIYITQVNVMALCLCTREAVTSMRTRGVDDGHIININR